jgi:hypothetical protein
MFDDRKFEEKYLDVLQNIEFAIVGVYHQHPELTDRDAMDGVEALIRIYTAEERGRSRPDIRLDDLSYMVLEAVETMCEWRLGRSDPFTEEARLSDFRPEPKTVDEILACLKRIRRSIRHWTKQGGRRGYLDFVSEFVR